MTARYESDTLHARMFRKWGKDRCRQAYRNRGLGCDWPTVRDRAWPNLDGGTVLSAKKMVDAWAEWLDLVAAAKKS